jgi:hypothetical protein
MGKKAKSDMFKPPQNPSMPTIEEFARMVESHDPTYVWSRDAAERARGAEERKLIDKARRLLGDEATVAVWNRALRFKVVPSMIEEFLWRANRPQKSA